MPVLTHLNEESYHHLHQTSLYQPTRREKKLHNMMQNPVEAPLVLQPKIWNKDLLYPNGYKLNGQYFIMNDQ